jgi:hypothetical protein
MAGRPGSDLTAACSALGKTVVGPVTTTDGLAVVTPTAGTSTVRPAYLRTTMGGSQFFARCFRFHPNA